MYEPYEDYDGDNYKDDEYDYDDSVNFTNNISWNFQIDTSYNSPISAFIYDILNNKTGFDCYVGNNIFKEPIWKTKYWIEDKHYQEYIKHLNSNVVHFLKQPSYYKGMFEILN